jgi:cell division protein FtsB
MNIKEYLASGILEQYLLGELSPAEDREVEHLIVKFPEIRHECFILSDVFEKMCLQTGIEPPSELKDQILEEIGGTVPVKVVVPEKPVRPTNYLALVAFITAFLGLLVAAWLAYTYQQDNKSLKEQIAGLYVQISQLDAERKQLNTRIDQLDRDLHIMNSPEFKPVDLWGQPIAPQAHVRLFWNQETQDIFLKADHLPTPETGKQYQLWAIVRRIPIGLGSFDIPEDGSPIRMTGVTNAVAFYVTLESSGGADKPTPGAIFVSGSVAR